MKTTIYVRHYSLYIVCRLLFVYRIIKFVHYLFIIEFVDEQQWIPNF